MSAAPPGGPEVYPLPEVAARWVGRTLGIEDIMELLPHRPPFLLVDRILELEPAIRAVGVKGVTIGEPFFSGHFPGHPVMPGVLIIEAMAQVAGVVLLSGLEREKRSPYFTGIKEAKFRQPVRPGDLLTLVAVCERSQWRFGRLVARLRMQASVDGAVVAECLGSFALVERE